MNFLLENKIKIVLGALVLYAAATGVSYAVFKTVLKNGAVISTPFGRLGLSDTTSGDEQGTKDQPCPLNGVMYTKGRKDIWTKRRPLAVMIENHTDARPVIGLSRADVVYEAVAEGGITRHMAVYLCQDAGDLAPIRSARTYFIDWLSEYDALYAHVGGANDSGGDTNPKADALGQIRTYKIRDMDQFGLGFPTYWRGTDKLAPHNVHSTTTKLWEAADKKSWGPEDDKGVRWDKNFTMWKFKDEATEASRGDQKPIVIPFWTSQPDYTETWTYDKTANVYKRSYGQEAAIDPLTKENLTAKNLIVQLEVETRTGDHGGHLLYDDKGSGQALIFIDGKATVGKWVKTDRTSRTKFTDSKGKEIEMNRGQIWILTVPVGNNVQY